MSFLIVMVLLLVVMYVLMIRPQRQRQQAQQTMIDGAGVGDDILTSGGIYGTITEIEDDDVVVEIADGLTVHMTRRGSPRCFRPKRRKKSRRTTSSTPTPSRTRQPTMKPSLRRTKKRLRAVPILTRPRPTADNVIRRP